MLLRCRPLALALLPLVSACADYQSAFIEAEDVRIELPGEGFFRAEQGDVYTLIRDTTDDVNGWVTETVEGVSQGIEYFNRWREVEREGDFRVYGPWTDTLGRNVNWVLKVSGDELQTNYEVWIAKVSTWDRDKFDLFLAGELEIHGDDLELRSGGFVIDFDVLEQHDGLKRWDLRQNHYGGKIAVTFERDTASSKKYIDLDLQSFWVDVAGEDVYHSDEIYSYRREADGSGTFELALTSTFASQPWSGPGVERMTLESRWDASEAGRARGMILEQQGSGDLIGGDMIIEECFASDGSLTWRVINEPYAGELPGYNMGDAQACVFEQI